MIGDERFDRIVDETGALPAEVSFELVNGRTISQTEMDAPWGASQQQTTADLMPKFMSMAVPVLGESAQA